MNIKYLIKIIDLFSSNLKKKWNGTECYKEMIKNNDSNMLQAEWGGFYFEYLWKKFLKEKNITKIIFQKNKNLDFDLYFLNDSKNIGELKSSNINNNIILNDEKYFKSIFDNEQNLFIILLEYNSIKDIDCNNQVTFFWNTMLNKIKNKNKKLNSYEKRMKNTIFPISISLLKINKTNKNFLGIFCQGKNSNGKPRNKKYIIKNKNISKFIIYKKNI